MDIVISVHVGAPPAPAVGGGQQWGAWRQWLSTGASSG
jgi:hypothetical protein